MCEHGNTKTLIIKDKPVDIDSCIFSMVKMFNENGYETIASCCGHGKIPSNIALTDGRFIDIHPNRESWIKKAERIKELEEEREKPPEDILVCKCGWWGSVENQDALGSECGCCPTCGNEELIWLSKFQERIKELETENKLLKRPLETANFNVDGMLAVGNELTKQTTRIRALEKIAELALDIHTKDPLNIKKKWKVWRVEAEQLLCEMIEAQKGVSWQQRKQDNIL